MRKLILIGNGFDLAHGMKTSYSDFLLWYLNEARASFNMHNKYEDDFLSIESEDKSKTQFKSNFAYEIVDNFYSSKWVDIERNYYTELTRIYKNFEVDSSYDRLWHVDIELRLLHDSFELVKQKLTEYLKIIIKKRLLPIDDISKHLIKIADEGKSSTQPNIIYVLNFNYTNTFEVLYKEIFKETKLRIINIHGELDNPSNPIIFGYGDETDSFYEKMEDLNINEFLKNFKSFYYTKTDNYRKLESFLSHLSLYEVHIMGHSCGLSDRVLLSSIFDKPNCSNIYIYYYQKSETETDFFEKTQEISRHFKGENKGRMRTVIVPEEKCLPLVSSKADK